MKSKSRRRCAACRKIPQSTAPFRRRSVRRRAAHPYTPGPSRPQAGVAPPRKGAPEARPPVRTQADSDPLVALYTSRSLSGRGALHRRATRARRSPRKGAPEARPPVRTQADSDPLVALYTSRSLS